eukprot:gnl/MRDRNA2_/MRDRNA2_148741_c0_seq1.p1 gnl/MRDRNA2_/MRDRNA2_148741_c0~~gnl/MRDRNA2_/MRDRNA2_148741_c0_seq1.p1  ORF type:complete len:484 (+),score=67.72 gnl/MRDRNA2_/MRDRNA2_148741_c0_seq1:192-1643(+)
MVALLCPQCHERISHEGHHRAPDGLDYCARCWHIWNGDGEDQGELCGQICSECKGRDVDANRPGADGHLYCQKCWLMWDSVVGFERNGETLYSCARCRKEVPANGRRGTHGVIHCSECWTTWDARLGGGGDYVAATAAWLAAERAREVRRQDRIFEDRFAETLAGEEGFEFGEEGKPVGVNRTRFVDDFVLGSCHSLGIRQVVDLGAGMDTRAVRLKFPEGVVFYELDKPSVLSLKEKLLQPILTDEERKLCQRILISMDFLVAISNLPPEFKGRPAAYMGDVLIRHGFDPEQPSCWILEGLTYYLDPPGNDVWFECMSSLTCPGSVVFMDVVRGSFIEEQRKAWYLNDSAKRPFPLKWGHDDPFKLLEPYGFHSSVIDADLIQVNREHRHLIFLPDTPDRKPAETLYVTAVRKPISETPERSLSRSSSWSTVGSEESVVQDVDGTTSLAATKDISVTGIHVDASLLRSSSWSSVSSSEASIF